MADDDLSTRLHWPADPLDAGQRTASAPTGTPERPPPADPPRPAPGSKSEVGILRDEVAALRRAIEELSDRVRLEPLTSQVEALRLQLVELRDDLPAADAAPAGPAVVAALEELRTSIQGISTVRAPAGSLAPIVEELGALRQEVVSLRRRVTLRSKAVDDVLDDDQLERIVEAVVDRVVAATSNSATRRRR
jgi:hypothetical protein